MIFRSPNHWLAAACLIAGFLVPVSAMTDEPAATQPDAAKSPAEPTAGAEAVDARPTPTAAEIAAWIEELDDNRYLVREQATRRLLEAGMPALDMLLAAANGDRPERADRALWVMRRLSSAEDLSLRRQALERLVQVQDRPQLTAGAQQALAVIRHREAVAAIEKLGGRFNTRSPPFGENAAATEPFTTVRVIFDSQWRGGDAGLAHCRELLGLRQVIVVGTDVTPAGLAELRHVQFLEQLWLYGTKLTPEDVSKVRAALPQVEVDYRRGGLLGVGTNTHNGEGPPLVVNVQEGSAAAAAGMKPGDLIQAFNGQQVATFKELTKKIGNCPPGEEIKLEVLRDGKPLTFTIKLGQWETI